MNDEARQALARDQTIDITTTGSKSGAKHKTEIWFMYIEGRVFITGTPGPRDWYANLAANPEFTFHLKESASIDLPARAAPVTDPAERERVMSAPATEWYRGQASMEQLIARSPMVEVHFE
ncbi:MAG: nitroreductase/quinone reductase family protein [Dehalococcoidia bacterium]|jgi:deazaflavin-dependent oxidoreductase (nitroreductase family)|nr:nitroreductase/quinone reductase family protein [Dehalococcoidia bacterium]